MCNFRRAKLCIYEPLSTWDVFLWPSCFYVLLLIRDLSLINNSALRQLASKKNKLYLMILMYMKRYFHAVLQRFVGISMISTLLKADVCRCSLKFEKLYVKRIHRPVFHVLPKLISCLLGLSRCNHYLHLPFCRCGLWLYSSIFLNLFLSCRWPVDNHIEICIRINGLLSEPRISGTNLLEQACIVIANRTVCRKLNVTCESCNVVHHTDPVPRNAVFALKKYYCFVTHLAWPHGDQWRRCLSETMSDLDLLCK